MIILKVFKFDYKTFRFSSRFPNFFKLMKKVAENCFKILQKCVFFEFEQNFPETKLYSYN